MSSLADNPDYHLTLRQADQGRGDFAAILDELDFVKVAAREAADPRLFLSDFTHCHGQRLGTDRRDRTAVVMRTVAISCGWQRQRGPNT